MNTMSPHTSPRFLITAGNTRQRIDQVRDWGNIFTGNTGFDIAKALAKLGSVDLCTSNREHLNILAHQHDHPQAPGIDHPIRGFGFTSHSQLRSLLEERLKMDHYAAIFMSAAVADYQPAGVFAVLDRQPASAKGEETWVVRNVQAGKVKSHYPRIAILGEPTEKLVDLFRTQWGYQGLLFKFKLEVGLSDEALLEVARESRLASGADYLIANTLEMVQGNHPGAYIVDEKQERFVARPDLAETLMQIVHQRLH